jgi:hypothetical protein
MKFKPFFLTGVHYNMEDVLHGIKFIDITGHWKSSNTITDVKGDYTITLKLFSGLKATDILGSSRFVVYPLFYNHLHYLSSPLSWIIKCVCVCVCVCVCDLDG